MSYILVGERELAGVSLPTMKALVHKTYEREGVRRLDVFRYSDYRLFLADAVAVRRAHIANWSYGVWARQLRLRSSSTLIMVLNGQRNPGDGLLAKLRDYFAFTDAEASYFHQLVRLARVREEVRSSATLMEQIRDRDDRLGIQVLDAVAFAAVSDWYHFALREMVHMRDFSADPAWIAEALRAQITPEMVQLGLERLLDLGLVRKTPTGTMAYAGGHVDTETDRPNPDLRQFHSEALRSAAEALTEIAPKNREISGATFAMQLQDMPKAKALIRKFQMDLCELLEKPGAADAVVHLAVALFPVTRVAAED